jgi:ABC-2 type transport system ATP-binding protein
MVLDHLNMSVPEHSVYGLVGPNGAGKTTTIKILMNARQSSDGRAEVFGHDSRRLSPCDFTQIGYVSENQQMPEWMTVEYFMNYLKPFYPNWDVARAQELLRQFELPPDRLIRNLSHGMRMKAALASSLAYRPRLIVLDEPFAGLDVLVRDELIEGVLECADGATILISSHDLSEIESFHPCLLLVEDPRGEILYNICEVSECNDAQDEFEKNSSGCDRASSSPAGLPKDILRAERESRRPYMERR